jgi:aminoglycoside phosphotransferase (APT) family kinase protein
VTDALGAWLGRALGVDDLRIETSNAPPRNGASNDTLMVRTSHGGFVVRTPPTGPSLYDTYDLAGQYRTMAALAGTDVPVPSLVGYEPDPSVLGAPFYVMAEMDGEAPPDLPPFTKTGWVLELPPEDQAALYERSIVMLARVHRLDAAALDVGHLAGSFDDQLVRAERWFRWAVEDRDNPVLEATLGWLHRHRPAAGPVGLCWGDARIGNMLYRGLEPVAVLDWEMAAVGPPEVDLGWWLFLNRHHTDGLGVPRLPGFPDDDTTVAMWSDAFGRPAADVFYYDVFAGFRFGIIVGRAARQRIAAGTLPEDQSFERVNGATTLLASMLDLPLPG